MQSHHRCHHAVTDGARQKYDDVENCWRHSDVERHDGNGSHVRVVRITGERHVGVELRHVVFHHAEVWQRFTIIWDAAIVCEHIVTAEENTRDIAYCTLLVLQHVPHAKLQVKPFSSQRRVCKASFVSKYYNIFRSSIHNLFSQNVILKANSVSKYWNQNTGMCRLLSLGHKYPIEDKFYVVSRFVYYQNARWSIFHVHPQ